LNDQILNALDEEIARLKEARAILAQRSQAQSASTPATAKDVQREGTPRDRGRATETVGKSEKREEARDPGRGRDDRTHSRLRNMSWMRIFLHRDALAGLSFRKSGPALSSL
jgi:hypothetical protein